MFSFGFSFIVNDHTNNYNIDSAIYLEVFENNFSSDHTSETEFSFFLLQVASGEKLPKNWKIGSGFYKITYRYKNGKEVGESTVDCTASAVGGFLSITGK